MLSLSFGAARLLTRVSGSAVACGQWRGFSSTGERLSPVEKVAVIGSGLMGSGIAQV